MKTPSVITIERVVAFALTPILTAASGVATVFLAKLPGHPQVSNEAIYGFASVVSVGTIGSCITWLKGRQKFTQAVAHATNGAVEVSDLLASSGIAPMTTQDTAVHITAGDLETVLHEAATKGAA
jgi:hypothetical protein